MDTKLAKRPLVHLVSRRLPASSTAVCGAPPTTSMAASHCSSSSDTESIASGGEIDNVGGSGWPSTLSVLETPERRRLRRLLKTNNNNNPVIRNLINEEGSSPLLDNSYMSSPPMQPNMEHVFSPPTLKTPKIDELKKMKNVHLSSSPMRSFYFRQSPTHKPRLSAYKGSSSGRVPLGRVNRVLELPLPSGSSIFNRSSQQENLVNMEWPREESGYSSCSFNSTRLEDLSSLGFDQSTHVETPSKGLAGMDSDSSVIGTEFGGMCSLGGMHSSSPLKDSSNLLLSLNEGFIPEQASGPLEASVLDGINPLLNNFFLLPPPTTAPTKCSPTSKKRKLDEHNHYPATSASLPQVPAKRSALTRFRKSKSVEVTVSQSPQSPPRLDLDQGVDENALVGIPAKKFMVSTLDEEKWRLLIGETPDQMLVTSWARSFFLEYSQSARQQISLRNSTVHTISAGLSPYFCSSHYYKLD